jgi:serine/threonine protein kinase
MRVVEEAKHLMTLTHANIVAYLDVFGHQVTAAELSTNYVCIAMEYCELGTMADAVFEERLTFEGVVDAVRQAALGLSYAHQQGIVHHDVKLENILVQRGTSHRDVVKLADWGIARKDHSAIGYRAQPRGQPSGPDTMPAEDAAPAVPVLPPNLTIAQGSEQEQQLQQRASTALGLVPSDTSVKSSPQGTVCYQAPECHAPSQLRPGFRWAIDVWACACAVYEACTQACLPLGTGPDTLGRQALLAEWPTARMRRLRVLGTALAKADSQHGEDRDMQVKQALGQWVHDAWQADPSHRSTLDVLTKLPAVYCLHVRST